jgi:hypothetical protein
MPLDFGVKGSVEIDHSTSRTEFLATMLFNACSLKGSWKNYLLMPCIFITRSFEQEIYQSRSHP